MGAGEPGVCASARMGEMMRKEERGCMKGCVGNKERYCDKKLYGNL